LLPNDAPKVKTEVEGNRTAWKSLNRMETLSDDPAESKAAGIAVAFVDKAFAELELSGRKTVLFDT
jgi:hypothetical protein